jgi:hypothetical protein
VQSRAITAVAKLMLLGDIDSQGLSDQTKRLRKSGGWAVFYTLADAKKTIAEKTGTGFHPA